jgi:hypothetical protein
MNAPGATGFIRQAAASPAAIAIAAVTLADPRAKGRSSLATRLLRGRSSELRQAEVEHLDGAVGPQLDACGSDRDE